MSKIVGNKVGLTEERLVFFDNIKGLLVLLVVWFHYLGTGFVYSNNSNFFVDAIYIFNGTFHMPLFAFVSGYFSKNLDRSRDTAFRKILIPYLFINPLFATIAGRDIRYVFQPYGVMWYLLALYVWRSLLKDLVEVRYLLPGSIVLALVSRFVFGPDDSVLIKISSFTPFFLAGYFVKLDIIDRIRRVPRYFAIVSLLACFLIIVTLSYLQLFPYTVPLFVKSLRLDVASYWWLATESLSVIVGMIISLSVINLTSAKKGLLTEFGLASLVVFLFHAFPHFRELLLYFDIFESNIYLNFGYWTTASILVTFVLSQRFVVDRFVKFIDVLEKFVFEKSDINNNE